MKLVLGWRFPSVAITLTVDAEEGVGVTMLSTPQPVHTPSPTAAATANTIICMPRRRFRPKQQKRSAAADTGTDGLELLAGGVDAAVVTVMVTAVTVPDGVTSPGEKLHDAPTGNPEQVNEIGEENPFFGATRILAVPLCPALTVSSEGVTATEKFGTDPLNA
jgi:hypothetical protein